MPIYKIEVTRLVEYKATVQIERPDKQAAWAEVKSLIERYPELVHFDIASTIITLDAVRQLDETQMTEHERYEAAKDRADIVAVIRRYTPLHPVPKRFAHHEETYTGSCPAGYVYSPEEEKLYGSNAATVYVGSNYWKCAHCGCDGGAMDVIMRREGLSFADALARLEQFIKEDNAS
jgi:hypothetical protein